MSYTLLDVAKIKNGSAEVGIIDEVAREFPEFSVIPVRSVTGYKYQTTIRTGRPTVAFGRVNAGIEVSTGTYELRDVPLFPLGSLVTIDKRLIAVSEGGAVDLEMDHAEGVFKAALETMLRQLFDGVAADSNGFAGLRALTPHTTTTGTSTYVTNATGTTGCSRVYMVRLGLKDVHFVMGGNTTLALSPFRDELYSPASGTGQIPGRVAEMTGWAGAQTSNLKSFGAIYNLSAESGKGLTDALLLNLWAQFPAGSKPTHIFASKRSLQQLAAARTPILSAGTGNARPGGNNQAVGDWPTNFMNIPIIETEAILDNYAQNA